MPGLRVLQEQPPTKGDDQRRRDSGHSWDGVVTGKSLSRNEGVFRDENMTNVTVMRVVQEYSVPPPFEYAIGVIR
jgi:hypothetical protein